MGGKFRKKVGCLLIFIIFLGVSLIPFIMVIKGHSKKELVPHPWIPVLGEETETILKIRDDTIQYLADGNETYSTILHSIRTCNESIFIQMYHWADDKIGNVFGEEILKAAERGIKVRIVKDPIGQINEKAEECKQSFFHKDFLFLAFFVEKFMNVWWYNDISNHSCTSWPQKPNPLPGKMIAHPNIEVTKKKNIDHSKVYIFDNKVIFLGGMNIEDKNLSHDFKGRIWRDNMIKFKGTQYVNMFRERRNLEKNVNEKSLVNIFVNRHLREQSIISFEILPKIMDLMENAEREILLFNGYWGDPDIHEKIVEVHKLKPNLKITLLVPEDANHSHHLNIKKIYSVYNRAPKITIRLTQDMIHGKGMLIDDRYIFVGSANFNKLSMKKVQETNVLIDGKPEGRDDLELTVLKKLRLHLEVMKSRSKIVQQLSDLKYNPIFAFFDEVPSMVDV